MTYGKTQAMVEAAARESQSQEVIVFTTTRMIPEMRRRLEEAGVNSARLRVMTATFVSEKVSGFRGRCFVDHYARGLLSTGDWEAIELSEKWIDEPQSKLP